MRVQSPPSAHAAGFGAFGLAAAVFAPHQLASVCPLQLLCTKATDLLAILAGTLSLGLPLQAPVSGAEVPIPGQGARLSTNGALPLRVQAPSTPLSRPMSACGLGGSSGATLTTIRAISSLGSPTGIGIGRSRGLGAGAEVGQDGASALNALGQLGILMESMPAVFAAPAAGERERTALREQ